MRKKIFTLILFISVSFVFLFSGNTALPNDSSNKKVISMKEGPVSSPFSPAILINDTLFISGQLSINPETGKFEGETMAKQAERIIKNIEILCKKTGMDLSNVVKTTVFITDFGEFREFNEVFVKMFPTFPPTRATVQVAGLAMNAKIEISAVAVK